ncbi:hypothetical protein [Streptomyces sp. W4I9-2]|uniref:hypothetical protein n=1 Tax=Streptomyces sp. W4I9-2 TaxID=3042297 RepID=UPI0027842A8B|nr:hypothetical protein [Streptomyces sp. W4I9-2]MDQ0701129.1 hypothetical protein [Streptomyces sp. W4I9-2]
MSVLPRDANELRESKASEQNPIEAAVQKITDALRGEESDPQDRVPGKPRPVFPAAQEPTEPVQPLPPKADQHGPETVSPTGQPTGAEQAKSRKAVHTAQGARLYDIDHSLKAGPRDPGNASPPLSDR